MGNADARRMELKVAYALPAFGAPYYDTELSSQTCIDCQSSWKQAAGGNTKAFKMYHKKHKNASVATFFGSVFFQRLFAISAETRAMFQGDLEKQSLLLFKIISWIIRIFDSSDRDTELVELANRHIKYQVKPFHYTYVLMALMFAFRKTVGARFTDKIRDSWLAVFSVIMKVQVRVAVEHEDRLKQEGIMI